MVGSRRGRICGAKPGLPSPSEADGATCEDQKDEGNKGHPKRRCGVGLKVGVGQFPNFVLDQREQSDVDSKRDESNEGGEERGKGCKEGNRDVGGEREEQSDE